jgi:hypothetical protein
MASPCVFFFCKEHTLVIGNGASKGFVRDGCGGEAGSIQSSHVVQVARAAVATAKLALRAENVYRRGRLPERTLGVIP